MIGFEVLGGTKEFGVPGPAVGEAKGLPTELDITGLNMVVVPEG